MEELDKGPTRFRPGRFDAEGSLEKGGSKSFRRSDDRIREEVSEVFAFSRELNASGG